MRDVEIPFCDHLTVTSPEDSGQVVDEVESVLIDAGGHQSAAGEWAVGQGGSVWLKKRYGVMVVSATGAALMRLRLSELFQRYLWALAQTPHRVTRLDASMDLAIDAPPVLRKLMRSVRSGGVQFSRKSLDVKRDVSWYSAPSLVDGDRRSTGTLYIGKKNAEVRAAIYDKRQERMAAGELFDPGPWTRFEFRCGRSLGASLRDASEPSSLFWHFAGQLLPRPAGVPAWSPGGLGYEMPAPKPPDYYRQLQLLVDASADFGKAVLIADKLGPYGRKVLAKMIFDFRGQLIGSTEVDTRVVGGTAANA